MTVTRRWRRKEAAIDRDPDHPPGQVDLRAAVAQAWLRGGEVDLAACDYGPGVQGQFRSGPTSYYRLLAGLARITSARSIVEVGTHYGGSARAFAEGQQAAGLSPRVLTFDVEDRAGAPILGVAGIERVLADVRHADSAARLASWVGSEPIDIVFVDALKDGDFVESTVKSLSGWPFSWLVLDDIFANTSIRSAWDRIRDAHGERAAPADEVILNVRSGGYGLGVVAAQPEALAGLSADPLREAARRRWGEVAARLAACAPRDQAAAQAGLAQAARACTGEGEMVVVGAAHGVAQALAPVGAERGIPVTVLGGFCGQGQASDPHYEPPVHRGEPTLAEFRSELGDAASHTNLLSGDVPSLRWPGRPIELLVVEWTRDPARLAYAWRELLPWCVPGGSMVVVEGMNRDALTAPVEDLDGLPTYLDVLEIGRTCVALAPIGTPDPAMLRSISRPPDGATWSRLGVPRLV